MTQPFKLINFTQKENKILDIITKIYKELTVGISRKTTNKVSDKYYPYIPTHETQFMPIASLIYSYMMQDRKDKFSILDVGCGDGLFTQMIERFIDAIDCGKKLTSTGIEVDRPIYKFIDIMTENALSYMGYKDYNILYYYHPMKDVKLMSRLIDTIDLQSQAYSMTIFNNSGIFPELHYKIMSLGFRRLDIDNNLYYKIKN